MAGILMIVFLTGLFFFRLHSSPLKLFSYHSRRLLEGPQRRFVACGPFPSDLNWCQRSLKARQRSPLPARNPHRVQVL